MKVSCCPNSSAILSPPSKERRSPGRTGKRGPRAPSGYISPPSTDATIDLYVLEWDPVNCYRLYEGVANTQIQSDSAQYPVGSPANTQSDRTVYPIRQNTVRRSPSRHGHLVYMTNYRTALKSCARKGQSCYTVQERVD
ncbi:unnamed protein product [Nezara viridula]|uniref:Uncharacterized protein n=1 Tax=Nezara viridula TaxID=85310 RepID=A0A9P0HRK6_NEZVI|nr:unnamed protein product [Nezara viridula]